MELMLGFWMLLPEVLRLIIVNVAKIVAIVGPLMLAVAYFTFAERKVK